MTEPGGAMPPAAIPGFSPRADPRLEPPVPLPPHRRRRMAWAVVVIALGFLVPLTQIVDVRALVHAHPPPRTLPPPAVDGLLFVAFPDFPIALADSIRNDVSARYGLAGGIFVSTSPLEPAAWNENRGQFGAEVALDSMVARTPGLPGRRTLLIGLTTQDLYIESMRWNWAFALRRNGAALVSMARMHRPLELDGARSLVRKMVVREMGFLVWRLQPTDDPGDLMYRDVLSLHDLLTMADDL